MDELMNVDEHDDGVDDVDDEDVIPVSSMKLVLDMETKVLVAVWRPQQPHKMDRNKSLEMIV